MSMVDDPPVVYVLHGEDEFGIASFLADLSGKLGDATTAAMNTTRMDGNTMTLEGLREAAMALPFLASRRLVVVTNPSARLNFPEIQEKFFHLLDQVPVSIAVILVEGRTLKEDDWLLRWAMGAGSRAYVRSFAQQKEGEMVQFILQQARQAGGQFAPAASWRLARMVGSDTRLAFQEVHKLLAYVNYKRPVEPEDVETLSVPVFHDKIFALVDALAVQDGHKASGLLRRFLEEEDPMYVMAMIVRQFRLLLLAREILDQGGMAKDVQSRLKLKRFEASKITEQARRFSLAALEGVYRSLRDIDEAIKSGRIEDEVALDSMVAGFTTR